MGRLVALDLPGGPAFVAALRRAWDAGDAVAPVPQGTPAPARDAMLAALAPHAIVTAHDPDPVVVDRRAPPVGDGDALVVATSGSTGEPKVLVHTHAGLRAHAAAVHDRLAVDPARDRWLACLPLHHLGGFGVVARSILTDTPVDVLAGFELDEAAAAPTALGTTLVSFVPTTLDRLSPRATAAFRTIVLGGAADPVDRPANVVRTYGATETGGGVVYDGRPLDGVEVELAIDAPAAGDGIGPIRLRTPTLARGRRDPDGSVRSLTDDDGWFTTGDLGRWEGDRLVVAGRADDLIISGGENVWPGPVEAVLRGHPAVAEVAVVGRPDPTWGQQVVAIVVPADPASPPTLAALRSLALEHLPAHAAPRDLELTTALRRTALGKVVRPR